LGSRIKFERKKQEIPQSALAYGVCSISYLSKIENDKINPNPEIVSLICDKLNIQNIQSDDPRKLIPRFRDDIERLYTAIKYSGEEEVVSLFNRIEKDYESLTLPSFYLVKKLFSLRIDLLRGLVERSEQTYSEILNLTEYLDPFSFDFYHRFCGLYNYMLGDLKLSLHHYKEAELSLERQDIEEVYYQMGLVYTKLENISLSTYYTTMALSRYENILNYRLCKNCNLLLAVNYRKMGENDKALAMYQAILNGLDNNSDEKLKAKVFHNMGLIHNQMEKYIEAVKYYKKSISYKGESGDPSNTLYLLAKTHLHLEEYREAQEIALEGRRYSSNKENTEYLIKFQVLQFFIEKTEKSAAFEEYMQSTALPHFKAKKDRATVVEFTQLLADYYENNHKYKSAYLLLKNLSKEK
jgi:tetratricopeptide (TPR) repeat protein